ncbi:MAG TPA: LLM class flavin-dependent oxidoreductase [Thermomicrobiales bacterium]|nr:LLM class flavin-dependent oxidoreductase [Thermomicrobiales bacterium]
MAERQSLLLTRRRGGPIVLGAMMSLTGEGQAMARHPWVAQADDGPRFGIQVATHKRRTAQLEVTLHDDPLMVQMAAGRLIEELGYDGLFLHDHPGFSPDPWLGLAALAAVTERVTLGSVVFCVPYRHPVYLARLATDVDNLSRGRLMVGLGIGWAVPEFVNMEIPFTKASVRQAGLAEAVEIIKGLWTGEHYSFKGTHYTVDGMQLAPRPIQSPRPPIMIAGGGERTTLRQVALYADASNFGDLAAPESTFERDFSGSAASTEAMRARMDVLNGHCEAVGRPHEEVLKTHFVSWLMMAPTEAEARAKFDTYFETDRSPFARGVLAGTPEQIATYYRARIEAGMQYFVIQMLDGADHETLELFAREVMPGLR